MTAAPDDSSYLPAPRRLRYCSNCASPLQHRIPGGDSRLRAICDACKTIHYQNPKVVMGTIPVWEDRILLCRRAIEPRRGFWTLPAGFMENGETTDEGAARETLEEAGARVLLGPLFSVIDLPHVEQIHMFYQASLLDTDFEAGPESLEVRLFREDEIPWDDLAFRTVSLTLELFLADRRRGNYGLHTRAVTGIPDWERKPAT